MAPLQQIEMLLASYIKAITNSNNKRHKKPANPGPTKQEIDSRLPLNAVYWPWGAKWHAIRSQEEEETKVQ
jgi:hypothetical protein